MNVISFAGFSPDKKFPLAEFAPYDSGNFEWNPTVCNYFVIHIVFKFVDFTKAYAVITLHETHKL